MIKHRFRLLIACIMSMVLVLSGCSSDGGGDGSANTAAPTTVSGKVTLSSILTGDQSFKARNKAIISEAMKAGKPGSKAYQKALAKASAEYSALNSRALVFGEPGGAFANGVVYLYNAEHPEWKYPVAVATTDELGDYELKVTSNAAKNGNAYSDGAPIPSGKYTLLAFTLKGLFPDLVALQSVVNEFEGVMSGLDLVAQRSTASPTITSMLGVAKNTDGTQTWGDSSLELAPNAAVQVSFSMPMFREAVTSDFLTITAADGSTVPSGTWTLSADWLTATYYLDDGETWTPGTEYNVTVMGADGDLGIVGAIYNIYGRFLEETGVGTFKVMELAAGQTITDLIDDVSPTATLVSPVNQTGVSLIEPIRISSNERMDVNGLLLESEPSLGAQPGVLFVGRVETEVGTATKVTYEYEFVLGEPLKLGTTYDITVSGGKDLAGNVMNELKTSFQTEATSEGIAVLDANATADEIAAVNAQVDVKDVFGKWIRSMNDRNLPQLQSVMSGDFFMEYNAANGFDTNDLNRDGIYDLAEFSEMMNQAFTFWDYCGVTVTGTIPDTINIVGDTADFEFVLSGDSSITNQDCKEAVPQDSLFATLQKINGAWFMVRASEGIDTRGQEISAATVLNLVQPAYGAELNLGYDPATGQEVDVTFEWEEIADAASYAMIFIDSRNPKSGFAIILPPTQTSFDIPSAIDIAMDAGTIAEISEDFGFTDGFDPRPGSEVYWQIAALGSNTVRDVQDGRQTSLPKDVVAMSELSRFKIAGEYVELDVSVNTNSGTLAGFMYDEFAGVGTSDGVDGEAVVFSELIRGYDLGDADVATLTITKARDESTGGAVFVDGNTHREYCFDFDASGQAKVTIALNQGVSNVGVMDDKSRSWTCQQAAGGTIAETGGFVLEKWFQINSTGGIPTAITINSVADQAGTALVNDGWDFYQSDTATAVTISGSVDCTIIDCTMLNDFRLELWNDFAKARASRNIQLDANGDFVTDVEVFKGENWVNINASICDENGCQNFSSNFGVKTAEGSVYVPPISEIVVMNATDGTVVAQKENWGNGGMWDVSAVTDNTVTITGRMEFAVDNSGDLEPRWEVGSDGGWQSDRLSVAPDGTFELTVDVFNGWNYVRIQDVKDNWFNIDLLTTLGNKVIRPEVTKIDTTTFDTTNPFNGEYTTAQCSVTIEGTAAAGEMRAYWNGNVDDPTNPQYYWEEFVLEADANGVFSVTVPLIGSSDATVNTDNFIDLFDKNWNWMGVRVINTADCVYTPPAMTVDAMSGMSGTTSVPMYKGNIRTNSDPNDPSLTIESGANFSTDSVDPYAVSNVDSVVITGTSTVPGRTINADMWICGRQIKAAPVTASDVANSNGLYEWSLPVIVYPGNSTLNISDGKNWYNADINVDNTNELPAPVVSVTVSDAGTVLSPVVDAAATDPCAGSQARYDLTSLTTQPTVVTISGTSSSTIDGEGEWQADGSFGRFQITGGAFSFDVTLYDGFNMININDADWNNATVEIFTSNGNLRPRYVDMDNAVTGVAPGTVTITGTVYGKASDGTGNTFVPQNINANVNYCDDTGCMWLDFSNDPNAADWGALPMTLTPTNNANGDYTYSFDVDLMADSIDPNLAVFTNIYINVDGDDGNGGWQGHGMNTAINDSCVDCNTSGYWKPGMKKAVKKPKPLDMKVLTHIKAAMSKGK